MNSYHNENEYSKTLRNRYKQVLGNANSLTPPKEREIKLLHWVIWLLIALSMIVGTVFYITRSLKTQNQPTKIIASSPAPIVEPIYQDKPFISLPALESKTTIDSKDINISEQDATKNTHAGTAKAVELEPKEAPKNAEQSSSSKVSKTDKTTEVKTTQFLVVVESTTSKNEAIERAKLLLSSGYPSQVILSETGYYGVILGRYDFETANTAIEKAMATGVVSVKPYIMGLHRVKEYINIETTSQ